jgi:hypothetical protein
MKKRTPLAIRQAECGLQDALAYLKDYKLAAIQQDMFAAWRHPLNQHALF